MGTNYYFINAMTRSDDDFDVFFENDVVAVGWSKVNFSQHDHSEPLIAEVKIKYYNDDSSPQQTGKKLNEVKRFKEIEEGDRIIIPFREEICLAVAKSEEYFNQDCYNQDLSNQRKVTYLRYSNNDFIKIPRYLLSEGLQSRLRIRGLAIAELNEYGAEIDSLFNGDSKRKITLSITERISLVNQYNILKALYPEESKYYEESRIIVEHGFEAHYNELNVMASESTMSEQECIEVMDILDMYRSLRGSYDNLDKKDKADIDEEAIQFKGFDGNDNYNRLQYARFLILKQGRWADLLDGEPGFDLNSHSSYVNIIYPKMLTVWKGIESNYKLSKEEIIQIINA